MEREFEEMRATVHTECERVCHYVNDTHRVNDEVELMRVTKRGDNGEWVLLLMGVEQMVAFGATPGRVVTRLYYSLLGLEARDAVEAERAKHGVGLRSRDAVIARQKVTLDERLSVMRDRKRQIIDLESRAAKLVEFAEKVLETMVRWQQEGNVLGQDIFDLEQGAAKALAAHKEGWQEV